MLTLEQLEANLAPYESYCPTWRWEWGPFVVILQEWNGGSRVVGEILVDEYRFHYLNTSARKYALEELTHFLNDIDPQALQKAATFLLNLQGEPTGKSALERLEEDPPC